MGEAKILLFAYLNRHQPPETMNFALVPVVVAVLLVDEVLGSNHHGGWLTFDDMADGDPHLAVHLQGNLDRPLCYNLLGEPGQVWSVFTDDHLAVSSTLPHAGITVRHERWNVVSLQFGEKVFYMDRSSRKFRLNRRSPINSVDFLGIYVKHDYLPKYGGIIGEFVGKTG